MKALLICLVLFAGQMNTLQDKPVVRLHPHEDVIPTDFGGKLIQLVDAPTVVHLPEIPPALDSQGKPWAIDITNRGTENVTIVGKGQFSVQVNVGRSVQIKSTATGYSSGR